MPRQARPLPATEALITALRHRLLPAVLTPMSADGRVDLAELERYATRLLGDGRGGAACGAAPQRASEMRTRPAGRGAPSDGVVRDAGAGAGGPRSSDAAALGGSGADGGGGLSPAARDQSDVDGGEHGEPDAEGASRGEGDACGLGDADILGGVAVWAHTGRGLRLARPDRLRVLDTFRQATALPIVAGVGVPAEGTGTSADETVRMAVDAAEHGADAVMVYPPSALRGSVHRDAEVLRLHERVAEAVDRPVIGFYLHGEAGGYEYPPSLLAELSALPAVAGVKLATLDRAMACQDAIGEIRRHDRLAITGEDRMFGPSLMWGADTALAGIAAARLDLTASVLRSWNDGAHAAFQRDSAALDRFAAVTFRSPIEGYVQRMFWAAVHEGLLSEHAAHDPFGPPLPPHERHAVSACLDVLPARSRAAD
ncbi:MULTISPECIES: dihydrodipicolinate synthase family protein [Actinoalloteichus]|uniref:Dihydrodipicolinate synthase/N-acetylneuraminate lyase n=1 Tax=Actinoalloteichus fjordicus TaxID=1612552 RepID=A0AAC9LDR0_9PSEU|nr:MULTISPECIES: dihydrodipicolinate synthase family protein [Actinoalloteichus]APU15766.1 dihydrodipicolinate synthase/N-acetylneuraminate lyase [Actinoalloteichus fjordicus]APU21826.1 dihydrodipicolinate synthase/N-acetylneuraminate lyase [Actinoalloteichus sp. GBA129-24]